MTPRYIEEFIIKIIRQVIIYKYSVKRDSGEIKDHIITMTATRGESIIIIGSILSG